MFNRIYLEITNHCNLSCSFCPPHRRNTRFLAQAELEHRISRIASHTKHVYFHVKGEPLMSPHLAEALDIAQRKNLNVHLVSNGLLIHKHGDLILNHPAVETITVSLHSYSELEPLEQALQLDVLKRWLAKQRPHHPHIRLRVWDADTGTHLNSRDLIRHLTAYEMLENARGFRVSLRHNRHIQSDVRFAWPDLSTGESYPAGRCKAGMMLAVLADGTITPCCLDGDGIIGLGNIDDVELDEVLSSQRYIAFKKGMNDRNPSEALCRCCAYKQRFDTKDSV